VAVAVPVASANSDIPGVTVAATTVGRAPPATAPSGGIPCCELKTAIVTKPAVKIAPTKAFPLIQRL